MSWSVTIRAAADRDLLEIRNWYEKKRSGLGEDFLFAASEALLRLEESAQRFPVYYRDFRRVLTKRFPFKIFYRIEGDSVVVHRVLHSAQDHTKRLES